MSRAEYDRAAAEQKQAEARVGEIRATIERKTIRAPFSGVLGIRQVNLGQYLSGGDPVVPLQSLDPIYVNFGVPQQDAGSDASRPRGCGITRRRVSRTWTLTGRVTADRLGRGRRRRATSRCRRRSPTRTGSCGPACSSRRRGHAGASQSVIALPASAISYAPYGDSVFVVADMKGPDGEPYRGVRQQFVKLGAARGDQVAVLSGVARARKSSPRASSSFATAPPSSQQQGAAGQQPRAEDRKTANEVHRPLRQAARPGHRRQPGDPDRRAAVDPRAQRPAVSAQRHRRRPRLAPSTSARTPISYAASSRRRSSA